MQGKTEPSKKLNPESPAPRVNFAHTPCENWALSKINLEIGIDQSIVGLTMIKHKGSKLKSVKLGFEKNNALAGVLIDERNIKIQKCGQPKSPAPRVNHNQLGHQRSTTLDV